MKNTNILGIYYFKKKMFYTPCCGLIGTQVPTYNNYVHMCAKIFFELLNNNNIDYYVFAGTSIGYVRNKSNIPWVDDYDIIIFEDNILLLENEIINKLQNNGFICEYWNSNNTKIGVRIYSPKIDTQCTSFQCDIFYSKVTENNIVKNTGNCGLYSRKNITLDMVKPSKKLEIDGMMLPFFNKIEEDVIQEYGDVINNCCIHIHHSKTINMRSHFSKIYESFNNYIINAKKNTLNYIAKNKKYEYKNNIILNNNFENVLDVLKFINANNVNILYIYDAQCLKYCLSIKHYFPKIQIIYYMFEFSKSDILFLNNVDIVRLSKLNESDFSDIIFIKKPIFEDIIVITFGTYDLFHIGHENILKRAKNLGKKLIIGVSSDELNIKKNKISVNDINKRILDVSNYSEFHFIEESLEQKDEYIKLYNANLLVMGDDWKNKFDWCSCPCMYLPRTPNISTTLLKTQINNEPNNIQINNELNNELHNELNNELITIKNMETLITTKKFIINTLTKIKTIKQMMKKN